MKTPCLFALLAALALPLRAADLTLNDGRMLKGARIVAIGDKDVTIAHAGGLMHVPSDNVPLVDLAKADADLKARAAATAKQAGEIAQRDSERAAKAAAEKQAELALKLAESNARARANNLVEAEMPARPAPKKSGGATLAELKARFPVKQVHTAVYMKDKKLVLQTATTTVTRVQGNTAVSTTRRTPDVAVAGKPDTITIEVPHIDVYSFYHGMVRTATPEGLARSIKMMEDRMVEDLSRLAKESGSLMNSVNSAQAKASIDWLNGTLKPYLTQLKALTR